MTDKMKGIITAICVLVCYGAFAAYCTYTDNQVPKCNPIDQSKVGVFYTTSDIGAVPIDNETCHIFQVYQDVCYVGDGYSCKGQEIHCGGGVIARITKCPSGSVTNTVIHTGGKFPHEEIK